MDTVVFETENFVVLTKEHPHLSREDGGHLLIAPKVRVLDRTYLSPRLAIELMRLTMIVGEAMTMALNQRGVDIGRINYQDNGNWSIFEPEGPHLHIHLYGRAKSAKRELWGQACFFPLPSTGYYEGLEPLNEGDIEAIREKIKSISTRASFQNSAWGL